MRNNNDVLTTFLWSEIEVETAAGQSNICRLTAGERKFNAK